MAVQHYAELPRPVPMASRSRSPANGRHVSSVPFDCAPDLLVCSARCSIHHERGTDYLSKCIARRTIRLHSAISQRLYRVTALAFRNSINTALGLVKKIQEFLPISEPLVNQKAHSGQTSQNSEVHTDW